MTVAPLKPVLDVRDLRASFGGREVLRGITFGVSRGEICVLRGASGSGKSTTIRAIAALQSFTGGSIMVDGVLLQPGAIPRESRLRALRERVGMVFQAHALFEHLTALQNVMLAPVHAFGWTTARAESAARDLLRTLDVEHRCDAFPRQLSGGEAQRVAIARALAPDPLLLLMDEPTSALDAERREALGDTVRRLAAAGRAMLIATHDDDFAERYAHRSIRMENGVIVGRTA